MKRSPLPVITNCDDCGACCTGQAALPVHLVGDGLRMEPVTPLPADLEAELRATLARFLAEGFPPDGSPCVWYDSASRRCKHYAHRPTICRDGIKPGDDACRGWRRSAGVDPQPRFRLLGGRLVPA